MRRDVVDRHHPANKGLPLNWTRSDQWMNWDPSPVGRVHTIAQVKETSYQAGLAGNGAFHPISWCRDYDGGRSFYTGMGRTEAGLKTAIGMAKEGGATLYVLNVVDEHVLLQTADYVGGNYYEDTIESLKEAGRKVLAKAGALVEKSGGKSGHFTAE